MIPRLRLFAAMLLLAAVTAALYWPGLGGGFFFDDEVNILHAERVRMEELSLSSIREAVVGGSAGPSGRPVAQLSFALNHYFSGFNPFAFKATNLAIHLTAGLLLFLLARRLLARTLSAGALAALWLLHPIQLTPVLHVVQRMTSLSALFLFAAMLVHVRARERGGQTGAAGLVLAWCLLWPLSFLSKETGALFPLFALAWELTVRRTASGGLDQFTRLLAVGAGLTLAAVFAYAVSPSGQWLWNGYTLRPFTLTERLLTEGRVLWLYLSLIAFPRVDAFSLYHDGMQLSTGLFDPWITLPALIGLASLPVLAWRLRAGAPVASFGIAWFLIGHALESTVLPLEIAHEHRNYVPLFGLLLTGAWGLGRFMAHRGLSIGLSAFAVTLAIGYAGFVTLLRAHQFGEEVRRTQIEAQHHPASARAHYDAGRALAKHTGPLSPEDPVFFFVRSHYEQAGKLDPGFKFGWLGLIQLNCQAGIPAGRAEIDELSRRLRETPFAPGDRSVLYSLKEMSIDGTICLGRPDMEMLFSAASSNPTASLPTLAALYSWYADYLVLREKDLMAAEGALAKSLQLAPANPSNRLKMAQLVLLDGRKDQATQLLKALRNAPLSVSEKKTAAKLLACLEGDSSQCGKI